MRIDVYGVAQVTSESTSCLLPEVAVIWPQTPFLNLWKKTTLWVKFIATPQFEPC